MTNTRNTPRRRKEARLAAKIESTYKPGKGRQLDCLVNPLTRIEGLLKHPVRIGDLDSEGDWIEHLWSHPKMQELKDWLDAEEAAWAANYKWKRSSLLFVIVVSLALGLNLTAAYNRVRTDDRLRRLGGFEPRLPRRERRAFRGAERDADPKFPVRQAFDDFVNRWSGGKKKASADASSPAVEGMDEEISERGLHLLALLEKIAQEVAFEGILTNNLDTTRFATDGSIVLSGHRRHNPFRTDDGAEMFTKSADDGSVFGRMHHAVIMVGAPFMLVSELTKHGDGGEPTALKAVVLPNMVEASRRFVEFAAAHGIDHQGFSGAVMCGDGALHNHPCIEATFNHGFLAAYNVGGNELKTVGLRRLPTRKTDPRTGEVITGEKIVDLRDDGALLCRCSQSNRQATRPPMRRTVVKRYQKAYVTCDFCTTRYFTTPRGKDVRRAGFTEKGEIDLRYDVTLPRWDERVIAMCFKARNEVEAVHAELRRMGLLPDGRGGDHWRSMTGDYRHRLWYSLGHLLWNLRVAFNLSQLDEVREYGWEEGRRAYLRNRHKLERQSELAEKRYKREKDRNVRRAPAYPSATRTHKLTRTALRVPDEDDLAATLRGRAGAHGSS
jgi:hypothetical protein